jgi:hypothetical protein
MAKKFKEIVRTKVAPPTTFGTNPMDPWSTKSNIAESRTSVLKQYISSLGIEPDSLSVDSLISYSKSSEFEKWNRDRKLMRGYREETEVTEDLRKWFKQKWVRMDTKGNIKGDCARDPGEGKPKCLPQARAHALGKEGRAAAARRKRREDPDPDRHGAPINVRTESAAAAIAAATAIAKKKSGNYDSEGFRKTPYKNPDHPLRKSNAQREKEMNENDIGESCWAGYEAKGMKKKGNRMIPNCVPEETNQIDEKNVPTSPEKWARAKAAAKSKFAVYPSAYANGWASKKYKSMGGGWKSVGEETTMEAKKQPLSALERLKKRMKKNGYDMDAREKFWTDKLKQMDQNKKPVQEVLDKDASVGDWIHDFVHSKNPKFKGKSTKERQKMALGAYYAKQKEEVSENHIAIAMGKMLDDEGSMVLNQLEQIERAVGMVRSYIGKDYEKQLPAWVQSKITLAADYIDTVGNYLISKNEKVSESRIISNSASIIKEIYKNKLREDMTDPEKEDKSVANYGKKPKMSDNSSVNDDKKPLARAVLKGGTTMTGQKRDTIEIDPALNQRPNQTPDYIEKTGKKAENK